MRKLILIVSLFAIAPLACANQPDETLERYFHILTERNYANIGALMDKESMAHLKSVMDDAISKQAAHGNYEIEKRIFGRRVTPEELAGASPEFYIDRLANQVLEAADLSRFFVDNRVVLGHVDEGDSTVHYVVRLYLHQGDRHSSEIYVYTLVKEGDDWKLNFPPTIRQMLTLIESSAAK